MDFECIPKPSPLHSPVSLLASHLGEHGTLETELGLGRGGGGEKGGMNNISASDLGSSETLVEGLFAGCASRPRSITHYQPLPQHPAES